MATMKTRLARAMLLAVLVLPASARAGAPAPGGGGEPQNVRIVPRDPPTADHHKFSILQQDFKTGPEVTEACTTCHTEAAKQVMGTYHWTWKEEQADPGDHGQRKVFGKAAGGINNFCITIRGSEPRCTSCHTGYGWKDDSFDFNDPSRVDCLVCHADPKLYAKYPSGAGDPVYKEQYPDGRPWPPKGKAKKVFKPVDLAAAAQSVTKPRRANCGKCHFNGGGGENVKHGDLDNSLLAPTRDVDVHMDAQGLNFTCQDCHTTHAHDIAGRYYNTPAYPERAFRPRHEEPNLLACEACHTAKPHQDAKLNDHTDVVSCEACHIPVVAKKTYTKMWWDWSESGKRNEQGKPYMIEDEETHKHTYWSLKGSFVWAKELKPEYIWYDGHLDYLHVDDKVDDQTPFQDKTHHTHGAYDKIDPSKPVVELNWTSARYGEPNARIYPVKIHRGKQPYDPVNKLMITPKLFPAGKHKGAAFWKTLDWPKAIEVGMKDLGRPYSGKFDWIQTQMIWPLSHMVSTKDKALQCQDCHTHGGRLETVAGVYIPGRDGTGWVDLVGLLMMLSGLAFGLGHGLLRLLASKKRRAA